jgi:4-amino-4-deoxy-L-arabinose transferase-like glycosyltransferase
VKPKVIFLLILLLAATLRFYRLEPYMQFLGDEGRDVLVVKQMIVDHKWTLLGPTASVGGFYTGPIYYYFMIPFLWLWGLDPVGPAVMAVLFGLATVALIYRFCRDIFGEKVALLAAFLTAVSPKMVDISRFSWNPNPVPFFVLVMFYTFVLFVHRSRGKFALMAGVSLGILLQLHYINLILVPIAGAAFLFLVPRKLWLKGGLAFALGLLAGLSLFLLFEVRHSFPNSRSVVEFILRPSAVSPRNLNFIGSLAEVGRRLYETVFGLAGWPVRVAILVSALGFGFWAVKHWRESLPRLTVKLFFLWAFLGMLGISLYRGNLLEHYLGYLYPLPIILLAVAGKMLASRRLTLGLLLVGAAIFLKLEIGRMYFWHEPNNMVAQTKAIDNIVLDMTAGQPFNFALIAPGNSDHAYRYFLDIWGRSPVVVEPESTDPDRKTATSQLVVVCELKGCGPLGYSSWEVAGFGRAEIVDKKEGPAGIMVFKLVHYNGG